METANDCRGRFRRSHFIRITCKGFHFVVEKLGFAEIRRIWTVFRLSLRRLAEVFFVVLFFIIIYSIWGLHLFHGRFHRRCRPRFSLSNSDTITDGELCGKSACPDSETCTYEEKNPDYGFTNFDHFGWSLMAGLRLATVDYWEGLYHLVRNSMGRAFILYFVVVVTTSICLLALFPSLYLFTLFELKDKEKKKTETNRNEGPGGSSANDQGLPEFTTMRVETEENTIRITDVDDDDDRAGAIGANQTIAAATSIEPENTFTDRQLMNKYPKYHDTKCYSVFCLWSCCQGAREKVGLLICNPFVELLITAVVIANVIAYASDHDNMSDEFYYSVRWSNYVFVTVVAIEALLKIFAMSPGRYFLNGWNVLDFIIAITSLSALLLEGVQGLSILRGFQVIRILKLGRLWPSFYNLLDVLNQTGFILWNFLVLITIILTIFAVVGMEIFGQYYKFPEIRWNFVDMMHSWMAVFRIFCGEWIELAWDCMFFYGISSILFFIIAYIVGHLILIYPFLVFLVDAGSSDHPPNHFKMDDLKVLYLAVEQFYKAGRWIKSRLDCKKVHPNVIQGNVGADQQKPNEGGHVLMENQDAEDIEMDIIQILQERSRSEDAPPRCCPDPIYASSICWNNHSQLGQQVRMLCFIGIQKPWFERTVSIVIIIYSVFLAFDDVHLPRNRAFEITMLVVHILFGCIHFLEMLIRWTGNGMKMYFLDVWCWIDFIVMMSFITEFFIYLNGHPITPDSRRFLHTMRIFRIFRLSRELVVFENSRVVLNTILQAMPGILNFCLMGSFYLLIFAILYVQMFAGKFYFCADSYGNRIQEALVPDMYACYNQNFTWMKTDLHFDNILESFFTLCHVAAMKGWLAIFDYAADTRAKFEQPSPEVNIYSMLNIVVFMIFGCLLMYSLFIGVILDGYNRQKDMIDSSIGSLSKGEKIYYHLKNKMKIPKILQTYTRPKYGLRAKIYNFVTTEKFDIAVTCCIALSVIVLALVSLGERSAHISDLIFIVFYASFVVVFSIECGLKLFAFRHYYFKCGWNIADFFAVILAVVDITTMLSISRSVIPPLLLRIFRIPKRLKFLSTCKQTFKIALPRVLTVVFLQFLVIYAYAIFGLALFAPNDEHMHNANEFSYSSFSFALEYTFQLSYVLSFLPRRNTASDFYVLSLSAITYFFLLAVLLVMVVISYQEANERVEDSLTSNDIDLFYVEWQKYDPFGTGFIKNAELYAFVNSLPLPLQNSKPNKYRIVTMDLPLCKEDTVHHSDVLDAVVRNYLAEKGFKIRHEAILEKFSPPNDQNYEPVSSTLWRQREQICAHAIQKWWKFVKSKQKSDT